MHPWYGQELSHLEILWESASRPTLEGDILQQAFESLRMELGVPDSITDVPYSLCGQSVTNTWLKTLWASSQEFGFRIEDSYASFKLFRHDDQFLMSAFLHQGYGPQQLKILNDCRMFLKVITLSDITTSCGTRLKPSVVEGTYMGGSLHQVDWPRKPRSLPQKYWNQWKEALETCFLLPYTTNRLLRQPLGRWTMNPTNSWSWFYDPDSNKIFHKEGLMCWTYTSPRQNRARSFQATSFDVEIPPTAVTADVENRRHNEVLLLGHSRPEHAPRSTQIPSNPTTLQEALDLLDPADKWSVESLKAPDDGVAFAQAIQTGTAKMVSDGSSKDNFGTASCILKAGKKLPKVRASNCTPGAPSDQNAYRSELGGTILMVTLVQEICKPHKVEGGSITAKLDNSCEKDVHMERAQTI